MNPGFCSKLRLDFGEILVPGFFDRRISQIATMGYLFLLIRILSILLSFISMISNSY